MCRSLLNSREMAIYTVSLNVVLYKARMLPLLSVSMVTVCRIILNKYMDINIIIRRNHRI